MSVEYDLVVIGDSFEGIYAARAAVEFNARVALVVSDTLNSTGSAEVIYSRTLARESQAWQQGENAVQWGLEGKAAIATLSEWDAIALAREVIATLAAENSLEMLAALGVDIVIGRGEFCRLPQQALIVENRRLRSRAYLLATGSVPVVPAIEGLTEIGYLTPTDLWQLKNQTALPDSIAILGGSPIAIELAQSLRRLGKEISLVIESDRLLPAEDAEASRWLQAQLEAEGVRLFTRAPITQARKIDRKKWVQAGNKAIEADEILWAGEPVPDVGGLNLEGVGVTLRSHHLEVNEKLQTSNPRIYACGSLLGGYPLLHVAQYEASIAAKNALFWPAFKVDYRCIPRAIFTEPNLARVGMSEVQARQCYGDDAIAVRQYYKQVPQALVLEETTGFCKFVLHVNGEILGAHLVGHQAAESIAIAALAMQNRLKIGAMLKFSYISPTLSEIVHQVALEWQRDRLQRHSFLQVLRKSWFRTLRNGSP